MSNETILLVEDDPFLRKTFAKWLVDSGYRVEVAVSLVDATHILDTKTIDGVLTDVQYPGTAEEVMVEKRAGFLLIQHMRGKDLNIPAIIMSANPENAATSEALGVPFLYKVDFDRDVWGQEIENMFAQRPARASLDTAPVQKPEGSSL